MKNKDTDLAFWLELFCYVNKKESLSNAWRGENLALFSKTDTLLRGKDWVSKFENQWKITSAKQLCNETFEWSFKSLLYYYYYYVNIFKLFWSLDFRIILWYLVVTNR